MSTTPVDVPFPDDPGALSLRIALGACRLVVAPGSGDPWLEGTYDDPSGDTPLRVQAEGGRVILDQDRTVAGAVGLLRGRPTCQLRLGTARPYRLQLDTGASEVVLELGAVPLLGLEVRAGAGKVELRVDAPNPADADEVVLRIGAGALAATGLGNLAAARLRADGGAAAMDLDLTGELRRPLDATVTAGMSGVKVVVPRDRPVRATATTTLGDVDLGDGFVTRDGAMWTLVEGDPVLTVHATVALGNLQLTLDG